MSIVLRIQSVWYIAVVNHRQNLCRRTTAVVALWFIVIRLRFQPICVARNDQVEGDASAPLITSLVVRARGALIVSLMSRIRWVEVWAHYKCWWETFPTLLVSSLLGVHTSGYISPNTWYTGHIHWAMDSD